MRAIMLLLLVFFLTGTARAEVGWRTVGADACGDYLANRQKHDNQTLDGPYAAVVASWVKGYQSGHNSMVRLTSVQQLKSELPQDKVIPYLDKFCRVHTMKSVADGAACVVDLLNIQREPEACQ